MIKDLIFDIGAHVGRDTEFYAMKGFRVVAVEANPYCCAKFKENLHKYIEDQSVLLIEKAIADKPNKRIDFFVNSGHDDWGTVDKGWNAKYCNTLEKVSVKTETVDSLTAKYGNPYYMKIDVEGTDALCIQQLKGKELPLYLSAELLTYNNLDAGVANCIDVIHSLLDVGYTKFQLVDQSIHEQTKCLFPPKEGRFAYYDFDGYCSGLFGKELTGEWVGIKDILFQYIHYFYEQPNCCGDSLNKDAWFDIHCTYS